jgi:hypothetical protein
VPTASILKFKLKHREPNCVLAVPCRVRCTASPLLVSLMGYIYLDAGVNNIGWRDLSRGQLSCTAPVCLDIGQSMTVYSAIDGPSMPPHPVAIELTGLNDIQVKLEISAGIRSHRHSGQLLGPRQMDNADHCAEACMVTTGFATPSAYVEASCRTT